MPLGFGLAPWGTSIFGYGATDQLTSDKTPVYQKADGTPGTARLIDLATGDYVLSETGRFVGVDEVEQAVYLRLFTMKGSSILAGLGQDISSLKVMGENIQRKVEDAVNVALNDLIQAEMVEVVSVSVEVEKNRLAYVVEWRDVESDSLKETAV